MTLAPDADQRAQTSQPVQTVQRDQHDQHDGAPERPKALTDSERTLARVLNRFAEVGPSLIGGFFTSPRAVRDRCVEVSEAFASVCRQAGLEARVVSGVRFGYSDLFPGVRLLQAGHFAVEVDLGENYSQDGASRLCVDWTARQFDPGAQVPEVLTTEQWRESWPSTDPLSAPRSAS